MAPTCDSYLNTVFCHPVATDEEIAIPEDPQNTDDSGKIIVPVPLPDNAQQWVLEDFHATEISDSWKRFLVAPESQPDPPTSAEAGMKIDPPSPAKAENSVAVAEDLVGEEVHLETVALDGASEAKDFAETAEGFTVLEEDKAAVVQEVTSVLTGVSSEDDILGDKASSLEVAEVQDIEEVASPTCDCSTADAALHESSGPGKIALPPLSILLIICMRGTCVVFCFFLVCSETYLK